MVIRSGNLIVIISRIKIKMAYFVCWRYIDPEEIHFRKLIVFCDIESSFCEGNLYPLHEFSNKMVLANLEKLALLRTLHNMHQNCMGVMLSFTKHMDQTRGFGMNNLFYTKTTFG